MSPGLVTALPLRLCQVYHQLHNVLCQSSAHQLVIIVSGHLLHPTISSSLSFALKIRQETCRNQVKWSPNSKHETLHTRRIRSRVSGEGGWSFQTTLRRSPNDRDTSEVHQRRKTLTDSTSAQTGSRNMAVYQAADSSSKTTC